MDLADIRIALAVAREGSLAAASQRLGITQPTLSKAIARLERENKIRLFERLARGMRPTELGHAFLAHAHRLDLEAADLYAALRDLRQARAGVLRLGIGQGVPDRVVVALGQDTSDQGVRLELSGGVTDTLQRAVAQGELEFALIGLPRAPEAGLRAVALCEDPMVPMVPLAHPSARARTPVRWPQLAQEKWIVPARGTSSHADFEQNFRAHGLEPPTPWVASRNSGRELALATALGAIVLLTRSHAEEPEVRARFRLLKVEGGWPSGRKLVIVHRQRGYLSPAAGKAMESVRRALGVA